MIYPSVKNAKRKEIYKVQFIKQSCTLDSHLSSEGFSAICHFNFILHRDSNTCFNHSAIQYIFQWHSTHYDISDISILDDSSTSSVLPYTYGYVHRMLCHRISLLCQYSTLLTFMLVLENQWLMSQGAIFHSV